MLIVFNFLVETSFHTSL